MLKHELSPFAIWLRMVFAFLPDLKKGFVHKENSRHPLLPSENDVRAWIDGSAVPTVFQFQTLISLIGEVSLSHMIVMCVRETEDGTVVPSTDKRNVSSEEHITRQTLIDDFRRVMSMPIAQAAPSLSSPRSVSMTSITLADHYTAEDVEDSFVRLMNLPFPLRVRTLKKVEQAILDATFVHSPSWAAILAELDKVEKNYSPERSEEVLQRVLAQLKRMLIVEGVN